MTTPKRRADMARAQATRRQRERDQGIVRVLVKVHAKRKPQLDEMVGQWMFEDLVPPHVEET